MTNFPPLTCAQVLDFQFSSWYPKFKDITIKSTIIRPLSDTFVDYLSANYVVVPRGSDDAVYDGRSDDENSSDESNGSDSEPSKEYSFPELDAQIREAILVHGGVFPKLNFTSPQDAAWAVPELKCLTPADVYISLKSSDFVNNDLNIEDVFTGCADRDTFAGSYALELVLRKWYPIQRSREFRCFVREDTLIAISQRDSEFYDFLNVQDTQKTISSTIQQFWTKRLVGSRWIIPNYVFDVILTRDLSGAHLVDLNPFAPRTNPCLFDYAELEAAGESEPQFRVVDSPGSRRITNWNQVPLEFHYLQEQRSISETNQLLEEMQLYSDSSVG